MSDVYATRKDVYRYGLARGTVGMDARSLASVVASTDLFELDEHGFEDGDELLLRASEGGTLAAPLAANTPYYALRETASTFKVSATPNGSPIDLTSDGVSMSAGIALPFDEVLEFYSRLVDTFLPAHAVPLQSPYPIVVTAIVAELAAKKLQLLSGQTSGTMTETETNAKAQLERWAKGIPLRDARATASTNKAVSSSADSAGDPRGWGSGSLP